MPPKTEQHLLLIKSAIAMALAGGRFIVKRRPVDPIKTINVDEETFGRATEAERKAYLHKGKRKLSKAKRKALNQRLANSR